MKFVVSSNAMLTRLQAVSKVIGGKSVQPILDNILLVAANGSLYATASSNWPRYVGSSTPSCGINRI